MRLWPARAASLILLLSSSLSGVSAMADQVTGTAAYRERIAMLPGTVFEAVLEDVSLADAPAKVLGSYVNDDAGNPPYGFAIDYDPAAVDPAHSYSVRARLTGPDGRLLFVTDMIAPVLTRGAPNRVELMLRMVSGEPVPPGALPEPTTPMPRPAPVTLVLPQSFDGVLPCADCEGIRWHLDLFPDGAFHLTREWIKGTAPLVEADLGRWTLDPARSVIVLHGSGEPPVQVMVTGEHQLRMLDPTGGVIVSDLNYDLKGDGTLVPASVSAPLEGLFTYMADAAIFQICTTGETVPVSMEGDFLAAQAAYGDARSEPGAPLLMVVDGTLAVRPVMEGPDRLSLVIDRFVSVKPGASCAHHEAEASLQETYWKLVALDGTPVGVVPEAGHEPHMILKGGETPSLSATAGCNRLAGGYALEGDTLVFGALATTMMACPEPVATLEQRLSQVLSGTRVWKIAGQTLTLRDGDTVLAEFEAVYLP